MWYREAHYVEECIYEWGEYFNFWDIQKTRQLRVTVPQWVLDMVLAGAKPISIPRWVLGEKNEPLKLEAALFVMFSAARFHWEGPPEALEQEFKRSRHS